MVHRFIGSSESVVPHSTQSSVYFHGLPVVGFSFVCVMYFCFSVPFDWRVFLARSWLVRRFAGSQVHRLFTGSEPFEQCACPILFVALGFSYLTCWSLSIIFLFVSALSSFWNHVVSRALVRPYCTSSSTGSKENKPSTPADHTRLDLSIYTWLNPWEYQRDSVGSCVYQSWAMLTMDFLSQVDRKVMILADWPWYPTRYLKRFVVKNYWWICGDTTRNDDCASRRKFANEKGQGTRKGASVIEKLAIGAWGAWEWYWYCWKKEELRIVSNSVVPRRRAVNNLSCFFLILCFSSSEVRVLLGMSFLLKEEEYIASREYDHPPTSTPLVDGWIL